MENVFLQIRVDLNLSRPKVNALLGRQVGPPGPCSKDIGIFRSWINFRFYEALQNIVASQTEILTRNQDLKVCSHRLLDGAKIWRSGII